MGLPDFWVNTTNLNLAVKDTVLAYRSLGPDISMTHYWNAIPGVEGMFGKGWTFNYESVLAANPYAGGYAYLRLGTGRGITYGGSPILVEPVSGNNMVPETGEGVTYPLKYLNPPGVGDTLTHYSEDYCIWHSATSGWNYRYEKVAEVYRLVSISDKNGNTLSVNYNANGDIVSITDAAGRVTLFSYNTQGLCATMTAPDGRYASYTYDSQGRMTSSKDMMGIVTTYTYNSEHYLTSISVGGKTASFTWSDNERFGKYLSSITEADGKVQSFAIEDPGDSTRLMYSRTNPVGDKTMYKSLIGHPFTTQITNAAEHTTDIFFNIVSDQLGYVTHTNPGGQVTTVRYDDGEKSKTRITQYTDPLGNTTAYTYDGDGNMLTKKGPDGNTWNYTYDAKGNLTCKTSPLGRETHYAYDLKGQLTSLTDPLGKTDFTYDAWGNITSVTDPEGNVIRFTYQNNFGLYMTGYTDANENTTSLVRDNNQRITAVQYPDGSQRTISYDCCSPTSITNEIGKRTSVSRNGTLMPTTKTAPTGETLSYAYDGAGRVSGVTFPDGGKTHVYSGGDNLINGIKDASGNTVSITRDDVGRVIGLTDQIGVKISYGYDTAGRLISVTDPLEKKRVLTRDLMGRVSQIQTARGGTVSFAYDADGRLVSKSMDGNKVVDFNYADDGTLSSMVDGWGTTAYVRDKNGRVKSITYPDGKALTCTYNANGRLATITYPGGLNIAYQYDTRNRLTKASWGANFISLVYDAAGNVLSETRSNGTSSSYSYDASGRVMAISHKRGTVAMASLSFTRDAAGRITKQNMVLPDNHSLPTSGSQATYNAAGQLAAFAGANRSWDVDGNAKTVTGTTSGAFTHDSMNRLSAMTWAGVNSSFLFDGMGKRVRIVRGGITRYLHYDQAGRVMFETDSTNNIVACYVYTDRRLSALYRPAEGSYFYHFDQNGSTLAITDAGGVTRRTYLYLPFGAIAGGSGNLENRFSYAGAWGVNDDSDGLFFMGTRMYHANTRRFLERDPVGWNGGENLYAYAMNNPVESIDPDGTNPLLPIIAVAGVAVLTYKLGMAAWTWAEGVKCAIDEGIANRPIISTRMVERQGEDYEPDKLAAENIARSGERIASESLDLSTTVIKEVAEETILKPAGAAGDAAGLIKDAYEMGLPAESDGPPNNNVLSSDTVPIEPW